MMTEDMAKLMLAVCIVIAMPVYGVVLRTWMERHDRRIDGRSRI